VKCDDEQIAGQLKLSRDGKFVLWPQPLGDDDPQSWSEGRKRKMLAIAALTAFVPDFSSATGIASLFDLAEQFKTTPAEINDLTSNWSIFLVGWGGIVAVLLARRYGRLPVLFWSMLLGAAFQCGCTFSPNLPTFAGMRCLQGFFSGAPQTVGLYIITDIYPVHRQSRAIATWTLAYVASPLTSPWLFGYLCARQSWRWAYGCCTLFIIAVLFIVVLFGEETMYDRHIHPVPARPTTGMRYRIETLLGITGIKMAKYRTSIFTSLFDFLNILWRPHFFLLFLLAMWSFGFTIGIIVTNVVFLLEPAPLGFGLSRDIASTCYLAFIVGAFLGEIVARYISTVATKISIKRNSGVLESEDLLLGTIPGILLYVLGMCLYGWANLHHTSIAGVLFGVGLVTFGNIVILVSILAKSSLDFPGREGEISGLINLVRVLGGFAVPYFQTTWAHQCPYPLRLWKVTARAIQYQDKGALIAVTLLSPLLGLFCSSNYSCIVRFCIRSCTISVDSSGVMHL
jgi:MFS family permease